MHGVRVESPRRRDRRGVERTALFQQVDDVMTGDRAEERRLGEPRRLLEDDEVRRRERVGEPMQEAAQTDHGPHRHRWRRVTEALCPQAQDGGQGEASGTSGTRREREDRRPGS